MIASLPIPVFCLQSYLDLTASYQREIYSTIAHISLLLVYGIPCDLVL